MNEPARPGEVLIVGAGPAGLTAAALLLRAGRPCTLVDQAPAVGGRIDAGRGPTPSPAAARAWAPLQRHRDSGLLRLHLGCRAVGAIDRSLLAEPVAGGPALRLPWQDLLLAGGAQEVVLPFPGWTLPGVQPAGGLQLMVKAGLDLRGRHVVLAGSGPLLLAAAAGALHAGALRVTLVERASRPALARFAAELPRWPRRLASAAALLATLARHAHRLRWLAGAQLLRADGDGAVQAVDVQTRTGTLRLPCEHLGVSDALRPELALADLLGCHRTQRFEAAAVAADAYGRSSVPGVHVAGESRGVGGRDKAVAEARACALHLTGDVRGARAAAGRAAHEGGFALLLARTFPLPPEPAARLADDTIVCRCEDVRWAALRACADARSARLHERCGMGWCQGRSCSAALRALRGFDDVPDTRLPALPCRLSTLALIATDPETP